MDYHGGQFWPNITTSITFIPFAFPAFIGSFNFAQTSISNTFIVLTLVKTFEAVSFFSPDSWLIKYCKRHEVTNMYYLNTVPIVYKKLNFLKGFSGSFWNFHFQILVLYHLLCSYFRILVGYYYYYFGLLFKMCYLTSVLCCDKSLQSCQTLCEPITVACQAPLFMEFSRQKYWRALPFPSPGESSWPRDQTHVSYITCIGRQSFFYH